MPDRVASSSGTGHDAPVETIRRAFPDPAAFPVTRMKADAALAALRAERQQDKERIERLETALEQAAQIMDYGAESAFGCGNTCEGCQAEMVEASRIIAAALAVEEDAPTCNSGPLSESMRAAVEEEDAE